MTGSVILFSHFKEWKEPIQFKRSYVDKKTGKRSRSRSEWSPIRSVIIRVITKSEGRAARVRFVYNDLFIREKKKSQVMIERENMH